jgi:hypothetical protein
LPQRGIEGADHHLPSRFPDTRRIPATWTEIHLGRAAPKAQFRQGNVGSASKKKEAIT